MDQDLISILQSAVSNPNPLYSIFDRIAIKKHNFREKSRSELPKVKLTADGLATEFKELKEVNLSLALEADLKQLANLRPSAHAAALPYLFQKYGWRIAAEPSVAGKYPDAAFCDTFRAEQALENSNPNGGYLLVKGDLTGIQEYIYNGIQPKQADGLANLSKRLRARSVLVSVLTDFIANVILRELELNSWHLLFAGGGHFNLLLPDDKKQHLDDLYFKIGAAMRQHFGAHLELILADINCTKDDLLKKANQCFEKVNAKRDQLKNRQHLGGLADLFREPIKQGKKEKKKREDHERKIGAAFPNQHYLLEIVSAQRLQRNDHEHKGDLVLAEFHLTHHYTLLAVKTLISSKQDENSAQQFLADNQGASIQSAHILALNNTDFLPDNNWATGFGFPISFGFRFLGKNAPTRPNDQGKAEIMDFEQIAKIGQENLKKGEGFLRLGSLMLDVDDLGLVFSHGLGVGTTLAQIITLSREMNYFFTAHFDQRAKEHQVYIVYSGGDDAFAVGKWDLLIRFAKVLHEDFQKFICYPQNNNPDVHFSAGLFMSNPFYPIGRFYRDARKLQDGKAKKEEEKNSVDVFDHTMEWKSFDNKIDLGEKLCGPLYKGVTASGRKFSASFAYRIMQLVKTSYYERDSWEGGQFHRRGGIRAAPFASNVANMRYLFARNGFTEAEITKLTDTLERDLIQSFLKDAFNFDPKYNARNYLVALHFAMLQIRSNYKPPTAHE